MASDKTKELLEMLEQGVKDVFDEARFKSYLKVQSIFNKYSYRNSLLIYLQKPNATLIEGYKSWQSKYGRQVQKGEKAITIIAPIPVSRNPTKEEISNDPSLKGKKITHTIFRAIPVFDVSQTDGKPIPELRTIQLDGNSITSQKIIDGIMAISDCPISFEHIYNGSKGYYNIPDHRIAIKTEMSLDQTAKTMVHEYAHSLLHHKDAVQPDRSTMEVQAESIAYVVSNYLGLDTSDYSFNYVAGWSKGKELKELQNSLEVISTTSKGVIEKMENYLERQMNITKELPEHIYREVDLFAEINKVFPNNTAITEGQSFQPSESSTILNIGKNNLFYEYDSSVKCTTKNICQGDYSLAVKDYESRSLLDTLRNDIITDIKEVRLKEHYSHQFKSVSYLEPSTLHVIDDLNHKYDRVHTLHEFKEKYTEKGLQLETQKDPELIEEFNKLQQIVDDLKSAQLKEKQSAIEEKSLSKAQAVEIEM